MPALPDEVTTIQELKNKYKKFCDDRNWMEYDIRDVIISLLVELGEFANHFKWDGISGGTDLTKKDMTKIKREFADIVNNIFRLAIELNLDITTEVSDKLRLHAEKYPKRQFPIAK